MISIKRFNESKKDITIQDLEDIFAYAFDNSNGHEISETTIEKDSSSLPEGAKYRSNYQGDGEIDGFEIKISHKFYDTSELKDFKKYADMINEINTALIRIEELYNVSIIFFEESSNSEIDIIVGK